MNPDSSRKNESVGAVIESIFRREIQVRLPNEFRLKIYTS